METWNKSRFSVKDINLLFVFLAILAITIVLWSRLGPAFSHDPLPQPESKQKLNVITPLTMIRKSVINLPNEIIADNTSSSTIAQGSSGVSSIPADNPNSSNQQLLSSGLQLGDSKLVQLNLTQTSACTSLIIVKACIGT